MATLKRRRAYAQSDSPDGSGRRFDTVAYSQTDSVGSSIGWGQSLISAIALLVFMKDPMQYRLCTGCLELTAEKCSQ